MSDRTAWTLYCALTVIGIAGGAFAIAGDRHAAIFAGAYVIAEAFNSWRKARAWR